MNKNKLLAFALAVPVVAIGVGALIFTSASAQESEDGANTFVEKLAQKLGLDQSTVETAVTEVRDEMHEEREKVMEEKIAELVSEGTITQRQADLLNGAHDAREEFRETMERPSFEDMQNLSKEERQAKREEIKNQMEQSLVDKLNEMGYNTSLEELQTARDAVKDAGLMGPHGQGGHRGQGRRIGGSK